jgi:NhaC family Na+:H+ antiporter
MAATLGVPTLAYLPFVFFNLINPVVSIVYGFTGFTIERFEEGEPATAAA